MELTKKIKVKINTFAGEPSRCGAHHWCQFRGLARCSLYDVMLERWGEPGDVGRKRAEQCIKDFGEGEPDA